jgi:hypothetical protein
MSAAVRVLKLGVLHSRDRCANCGAADGLVETTLLWTRARAMVCADTIGCVRRSRVWSVAA